MRFAEAAKLKEGDLVVYDPIRSKNYGGLILEVESVCHKDSDFNWCYRVTLKQPGFDNGFRRVDVDSRYLKRYEP